jgi:DNA-binding transcriptional regulator GbsR (MarR family)
MTSRTARPPRGDDNAPHSVDADALARFVERFAVVLTEAGWPRMPARVFACLLADERGELTARELADRLRVSPAAISGAVRYLQQISLVTRAREPGARTDHYRLDDNVWYESIVHRTAELRRWEAGLASGVEVVGASTAAGRRLEESRAFFAFLRGELPRIMERWRAQQAGG